MMKLVWHNMTWIDTLNAGSNLFQAGSLGYIASAQNFQVSQAVQEGLRRMEVVELRRMIVKATGTLEDALSYLPTHPGYSAVVIPLCCDVMAAASIDEDSFDEVADMSLARDMKRMIRTAKAQLTQNSTPQILEDSEQIRRAVAGTYDSSFDMSLIPDEGELMRDVFSLIQQQYVRARQFSGELTKLSKKNWSLHLIDSDNQIDENLEIIRSFSIFLNPKYSVEMDGGETIELKRGLTNHSPYKGEVTLPSGHNYKVTLKPNLTMTGIGSVIIENPQGDSIKVILS